MKLKHFPYTLVIPIRILNVLSMTDHIHFKISPKDKKELILKAKRYGLGLSGFIRMKLKEYDSPREIRLREIREH